jgi:hypothetical protein
MLRFLAVPEKIVVMPEPSPRLDPSLEEAVEEIWQAERDRFGPTLFDGPLFSLELISPNAISGRYVGYRLFLAQERRPELFFKLRVQPLAVTGVLQNSDGVFFGYRNSAVAVQPDCWELIPSGGVDRSTMTPEGRLRPVRQVLTELWEEVGIGDGAVLPPKLLCFAEDPLHHIFELIWELKTALDLDAVLRAHSGLLHPEHSKISFVRWSDLERFLRHGRDEVTPASHDILEHLSQHKDHL